MTAASILKKDNFSLVLLAGNIIPESRCRECPAAGHPEAMPPAKYAPCMAIFGIWNSELCRVFSFFQIPTGFRWYPERYHA